jgi:hypothetical protein
LSELAMTSGLQRSLVRIGLLAATALFVLAPATSAERPRFEVFNTSGPKPVRCSDIDISDPRNVTGGCQVDLRGEAIRMSIQSVVGEIEFSECISTTTLHIDKAGRTALHVLISGMQPCNDVRPCRSDDERVLGYLPWMGRLVPDPGGWLRNEMHVCLDTCMGKFEGRLSMRLERVRGRLRGRTLEEPVGTSGYQLDGRWRGGPLRFEIAARRSLASGTAGRR